MSMWAPQHPANPVLRPDPPDCGRALTAIRRSRPARARVLALLLLWALMSACTTTIIPPATPADPVSVFVLDHGRHSSLVLPSGDGGALRYSYGDWDYYVLDRTGPVASLRALVVSSPAALGRQYLAGPPELDILRTQTGLVVTDAHEIVVAADAMQRLRDSLESLFEDARDTLLAGAVVNAYFVRHPVPYTLKHNSNLVVGHWLEALGCTVIGRPVLSGWRVTEVEDTD